MKKYMANERSINREQEQKNENVEKVKNDQEQRWEERTSELQPEVCSSDLVSSSFLPCATAYFYSTLFPLAIHSAGFPCDRNYLPLFHLCQLVFLYVLNDLILYLL